MSSPPVVDLEALAVAAESVEVVKVVAAPAPEGAPPPTVAAAPTVPAAAPEAAAVVPAPKAAAAAPPRPAPTVAHESTNDDQLEVELKALTASVEASIATVKPAAEPTAPPDGKLPAPGIHDVLLDCQRKSDHPGNVNFRKLVDHHRNLYPECYKQHKTKVALAILTKWKYLSPPGRFLVRLKNHEESITTMVPVAQDTGPNGTVWIQMPDEKAREEVCKWCLDSSSSEREGEPGETRAVDGALPAPSVAETAAAETAEAAETQAAPAPAPAPVVKLQPPGINDILFGRSVALHHDHAGNVQFRKLVLHHAGNVKFRRLVEQHKKRYHELPVYHHTNSKQAVVLEILATLKNTTPPGRFLVRLEDALEDLFHGSNSDKDLGASLQPVAQGPHDTVWVQVTDQRATEKIAYALRDRGAATGAKTTATGAKTTADTVASGDKSATEAKAAEATAAKAAEAAAAPAVVPAAKPALPPPGKHDFLLGRGGKIMHHQGNVKFRKLVDEHKQWYRDCPLIDKPHVSLTVLSKWRRMSPPGRFLVRFEDRNFEGNGGDYAKAVAQEPGPNGTVWVEVPDKKAREKVAHCIRAAAALKLSPPGPHDVLVGRGAYVNKHPGNLTFRKLVDHHKDQYMGCQNKSQKHNVALEVVNIWTSMNPPGRFLVPQEDSNSSAEPVAQEPGGRIWVLMPLKRAREKFSQACHNRPEEERTAAAKEVAPAVAGQYPQQQQQLRAPPRLPPPGIHDVLMARGDKFDIHPGNVKFRKLANQHKGRYNACPSVQDKSRILDEILQTWKYLTPPGRFLGIQQDTKLEDYDHGGSAKAVAQEPGADGIVWVQLSAARARVRVSECLRDQTAPPAEDRAPILHGIPVGFGGTDTRIHSAASKIAQRAYQERCKQQMSQFRHQPLNSSRNSMKNAGTNTCPPRRPTMTMAQPMAPQPHAPTPMATCTPPFNGHVQNPNTCMNMMQMAAFPNAQPQPPNPSLPPNGPMNMGYTPAPPLPTLPPMANNNCSAPPPRQNNQMPVPQNNQMQMQAFPPNAANQMQMMQSVQQPACVPNANHPNQQNASVLLQQQQQQVPRGGSSANNSLRRQSMPMVQQGTQPPVHAHMQVPPPPLMAGPPIHNQQSQMSNPPPQQSPPPSRPPVIHIDEPDSVPQAEQQQQPQPEQKQSSLESCMSDFVHHNLHMLNEAVIKQQEWQAKMEERHEKLVEENSKLKEQVIKLQEQQHQYQLESRRRREDDEARRQLMDEARRQLEEEKRQQRQRRQQMEQEARRKREEEEARRRQQVREKKVEQARRQLEEARQEARRQQQTREKQEVEQARRQLEEARRQLEELESRERQQEESRRQQQQQLREQHEEEVVRQEQEQEPLVKQEPREAHQQQHEEEVSAKRPLRRQEEKLREQLQQLQAITRQPTLVPPTKEQASVIRKPGWTSTRGRFGLPKSTDDDDARCNKGNDDEVQELQPLPAPSNDSARVSHPMEVEEPQNHAHRNVHDVPPVAIVCQDCRASVSTIATAATNATVTFPQQTTEQEIILKPASKQDPPSRDENELATTDAQANKQRTTVESNQSKNQAAQADSKRRFHEETKERARPFTSPTTVSREGVSTAAEHGAPSRRSSSTSSFHVVHGNAESTLQTQPTVVVANVKIYDTKQQNEAVARGDNGDRDGRRSWQNTDNDEKSIILINDNDKKRKASGESKDNVQPRPHKVSKTNDDSALMDDFDAVDAQGENASTDSSQQSSPPQWHEFLSANRSSASSSCPPLPPPPAADPPAAACDDDYDEPQAEEATDSKNEKDDPPQADTLVLPATATIAQHEDLEEPPSPQTNDDDDTETDEVDRVCVLCANQSDSRIEKARQYFRQVSKDILGAQGLGRQAQIGRMLEQCQRMREEETRVVDARRDGLGLSTCLCNPTRDTMIEFVRELSSDQSTLETRLSELDALLEDNSSDDEDDHDAADNNDNWLLAYADLIMDFFGSQLPIGLGRCVELSTSCATDCSCFAKLYQVCLEAANSESELSESVMGELYKLKVAIQGAKAADDDSCEARVVEVMLKMTPTNTSSTGELRFCFDSHPEFDFCPSTLQVLFFGASDSLEGRAFRDLLQESGKSLLTRLEQME